MSFIIGLDLGQSADFSALCVLEQTETTSGWREYTCRGLKRWPLGTAYTRIVADLGTDLFREPLAGSALVVDASGVGRPVVDMIRKVRLPAQLAPVVITAGQSQSFADGYHHVAKVILISTVQVLLEQRRLTLPKNHPLIDVTLKEFANYRVKVTPAANETFSARDGEHDDLVLAVAIAAWYGERGQRRLKLW